MDYSLILTNDIGNTVKPDDVFIRRLYNYYNKGGFRNIMTENVITLLINYFILFFINFLTNCIEYSKLNDLSSDTNHNFGEFINISNIFPSSPYFILCFVAYTLYLFCLTINVVNTIRSAWKIKNIYENQLNIPKNAIEFISWNKVMDRIILTYPDPNLNPYTITSKIMREDNLKISFYRYQEFTKTRMTEFLERNFTYCFISPLFNKQSQITEETIDNYKEKVKRHLILVGVLNLFALPFAIYIVLVYSLINYGEQIYHNPELIIERQWTIKALWRLRYYNELEHQYLQRRNNIGNILKCILDAKKKKATISIIIRFINFVLGSFFILLIGLSFINDNILTDCIVAFNRNVLWFIGVIGAIILLLRKGINDTTPLHQEKEDKLFVALEEYVRTINPKWFQPDMRTKCIQLFSSLYQYKIVFILLEIINLVISPYYVWLWYKEIKKINLNDLIEYHQTLGYVSKKSILTNFNTISKEQHTYASLEEFKNNNEDWHSASLWYQQAQTSLADATNSGFKWSNTSSELNQTLETTVVFGDPRPS